mgnify:FL=1
MKKIILILLILGTFNVNAQTTKDIPKNYFYGGIELGQSIQDALYEYEEDYPELNDNRVDNEASAGHNRLFVGYRMNRHRVEFSVQPLGMKMGYTLRFSDGGGVGTQLTESAVYLNLGYTIEPLRYKFLSFTIGPHIGIALAENSYDGDFGSSTSVSIENGVVVEMLEQQETLIRKRTNFLNYGGRFNLLFNVSAKVELTINWSVLYTPYHIGGFEFTYKRNDDPERTVHSYSKIFNRTFGIGLNYRFFRN